MLLSNVSHYAISWRIVAKSPPGHVHYRLRFASGIEYKRELLDRGLDLGQMREFQAALNLPRHVGVVEVRYMDHLICAFILDVSEVERDPQLPSVIGLVAPWVEKDSGGWKNLAAVAAYLSCPFLTGPAS